MKDRLLPYCVIVACWLLTLLLVMMRLHASSFSSSTSSNKTAAAVPTPSSSNTNVTSSSADATTTSLSSLYHRRRSYDRWNPQDEHPCTIRRVAFDQLATVLFAKSIGLVPPLYHEPLVIVAAAAKATEERNNTARNSSNNRHHRRNAVFRHKSSLQHILDNFLPDDNFTVTLSSSNQFSEHRRTIPLRQYLHETVTMNMGGETLPEQLANESWYLFGETYTDAWQQGLLRYYELPPCQTCQESYSYALSFGIGNRGSGVQWHTHGPGFSEALHGRKHWMLYPPQVARPSRLDKDQSSRRWMEDVYPTLETFGSTFGSSNNSKITAATKPYECTCKYTYCSYFDAIGINPVCASRDIKNFAQFHKLCIFAFAAVVIVAF
jgi:hypothetical protein